MIYNFRHNHCQPIVLKSSDFTAINSDTKLKFSSSKIPKKSSRSFRRALRFSTQKALLLIFSFKIPLGLAPLMLLPYALTSQALSATTANTIEGTKPYFTLNGIKLTNTSELAGFTYPDASVTGGIAKVDTSKSIEVNSSNVVLIPLGVKESDIVAAVGFSNPLAASSLDTLVKTTGYPLKIGDGDGDATTLADIGAKGEISVIMKKDWWIGYTKSYNFFRG